MKFLLIVAFSFILVSAYSSAPLDTISANNSMIEYTGRIDFSNLLAPKFSYSGVSIRASFEGTSISMMLKDEGDQNYYHILVDGKVISRIKTDAGLHTYDLSSNLTNSIHEIEIYKLTEQLFGKSEFCGFLLSKGKKLVAITNKRKRFIEFIGNSITCGYGNEGVNGGVFSPATENHFLTYAAITSRNFNARHMAVCKSGIGLYRNSNGPAEGNADCMSNYYSRIFLYDENPKYKFETKPDLICIDLGTNDFNGTLGDSSKYIETYLKFIDQLQTQNNHADIICLLGPMLSGKKLVSIRRYLNFIAETANKNLHGKVYFFEMSKQTGDLGIGINYHPSVAQHAKNAMELTHFISQIKGWPVKESDVDTNIK